MWPGSQARHELGRGSPAVPPPGPSAGTLLNEAWQGHGWEVEMTPTPLPQTDTSDGPGQVPVHPGFGWLSGRPRQANGRKSSGNAECWAETRSDIRRAELARAFKKCISIPSKNTQAHRGDGDSGTSQERQGRSFALNHTLDLLINTPEPPQTFHLPLKLAPLYCPRSAREKPARGTGLAPPQPPAHLE